MGTLYRSTGNFNGSDPRSSLWAGMPVWDDEERRWHFFYVAYLFYIPGS